MSILDPNYGLDPLQQSLQGFQPPAQQPMVPGPTGNGLMSALRGVDPTAMLMLGSALLQASGPQPRKMGFGARLGGAVGQVMPQILNQQSVQERTALNKQDLEQRKAEHDMAIKDRQAQLDALHQQQSQIQDIATKALGSIDPNDATVPGAYKQLLTAASHTGDLRMFELAQKYAPGVGGATQMGKYNPGDYTPKSWAKVFGPKGDGVGGTGDTGQLERYSTGQIRVAQDGSMWATGGPEGPVMVRSPEEAAAGMNTKKAGAAAADFRIGYGPARTQTQDTLNKIVQIKKDMAGIPTGPGGEIASTASPKLQELQARLGEFTLDKIAEFKKKGVSLSPMTERDFEFLKGLSGSITKYPQANMALLDRAQQSAQRIQDDLDYQMNFLESGGSMLDYKGRPRAELQNQPDMQTKEPTTGDVVDGYMFKGGDKADPNSWVKMK